jgi:hypothetical protein
MRKINTKDITEDSWTSPKGKFAGFGKSVSIALGRKETSTDLQDRIHSISRSCALLRDKLRIHITCTARNGNFITSFRAMASFVIKMGQHQLKRAMHLSSDRTNLISLLITAKRISSSLLSRTIPLASRPIIPTARNGWCGRRSGDFCARSRLIISMARNKSPAYRKM